MTDTEYPEVVSVVVVDMADPDIITTSTSTAGSYDGLTVIEIEAPETTP